MSIINAFDSATEAIINPASVFPPMDGFPKRAVVVFGEKYITALHERYEPALIRTVTACVDVPIYRVSYGGRDIAVYCTTLGGPATVGIMEEVAALGCEKFMFFGSCGVLDKALAATSLIVPTEAYRDEGTSYHYAPPGDYIEVGTAGRLAAILAELNVPHVCGRTWTTDAFFRETRGNTEKRRAEGCITVEMECASIMAAARFRGMDAYQFLYAADSLDAAEWDVRTLGSLPWDARERLLRVALEVAARI